MLVTITASILEEFPVLPIPPLKDDAHDQESSLETACDEVDAPGTPTVDTEASGQTTGPDKTAGCLDTHHGDTQGAHRAQHPGGVDLREILDRRQQCRTQAQGVGQGLCVLR